MSVGTGRQKIIVLFWKEQFHFWEFIIGNKTFILDSHRPFICSVHYLVYHMGYTVSYCESHPSVKYYVALKREAAKSI
jgi:hypothetical protein